MKAKIIKAYEKIGIEIFPDSILEKYVNLIENNEFKEQIELFHFNIILGLDLIRIKDVSSFKRYTKNLNNSKSNLTFWGEKNEVYWHSKLLEINDIYISNLRRGIDGKEPDLVFKINNETFGFELTTLKFEKYPKDNESIFFKIIEQIKIKNEKVYYSNKNCVLIIDITNLYFHAEFNNRNFKEIWNENFKGFKIDNITINFGMIIFCTNSYRKYSDERLLHKVNPILGLINEENRLNKHFELLIKKMFNNFDKIIEEDCIDFYPNFL